MARPTKSESKLTEAADKATALLQGLQSRLKAGNQDESAEDLDRQLREYFVSSDAVPDQIRERIIEAVADRILQSWERGEGRDLGAVQNQVIDRVAERILQRMTRVNPPQSRGT